MAAYRFMNACAHEREGALVRCHCSTVPRVMSEIVFKVHVNTFSMACSVLAVFAFSFSLSVALIRAYRAQPKVAQFRETSEVSLGV